MQDFKEKILLAKSRIQELEKEKLLLLNEIKQLELELQIENTQKSPTLLPQKFTTNEKIKIFISLFKGRTDVFGKRWENTKQGKHGYALACHNEWLHNICIKRKGGKCSECRNQNFISIDEKIILKHLIGEEHEGFKRDYTIGLYPLLKDDTCWFLAVDFDKEHWMQDISAFIKTCLKNNIPCSLERSRSGKGGHIWIFFNEAVPAVLARKMGALLLTETMENHPTLKFESYDRFFPNQDNLPLGGYGNLIALPLQCFPMSSGNTFFLDENFIPYQSQWEYLSSVKKMSLSEIKEFIEYSSFNWNDLSIKNLDVEDNEAPWKTLPSNNLPETKIDSKLLPKTLDIILGNQIFIDKQELPNVLINKIRKLASFHNPEFYKAQSLRLPLFNIPRIIDCSEYFPKYIGLPRGLLDECIALLHSFNIEPIIKDERNSGNLVNLNFIGELTEEQNKSVNEILKYDTGTLAATTAFGKTVIGAYIISKRKTNTLIIVHRLQLRDQWIERLKMFLNLTPEQIGFLGGGKRKLSGIVDIAIMQSLIKKKVVDDIVANYGQIIIDECHHISAVSFEAVTRVCKSKYVLGLTATAIRKDGHQPIIFMQCGPIRYTVDAKHQAKLRPFTHKVIIKNTNFNFISNNESKINIGQVYAEMITDEDRNQIIFNDVLMALKSGRSPLLLTERKDHVTYFIKMFAEFCKNIVVLVGGQGIKQRTLVAQQLATIPNNEERLLIATGRYIGEGFDDSRLDTLFLTMPISWHGTLAQYAGRLHRYHEKKKEVIIYDYVDNNISMLSRMFDKRKKGYVNLGYNIIE